MTTRISIIIITAAVIATASSCSKFLDVAPKQFVSDDATIYDKNSAETALRGAYRALGNSNYYGETYVTLGYFPSGDFVNNTTGGGGNIMANVYRSDDPLFQNAWSAIYVAINRANNILQKLPEVQDVSLTAARSDQIRGQAYFIRALAYFDLARAWGGVQLILTPTLTANDKPAVSRSTREATYAQVEKDLDSAEALLPNVVNRVIATRKTVWALKARLYLYQEKWEQAGSFATKLIEDAGFKLLSPYSAWFAGGVTGTDESIFELEFSVQNPSAIRSQMQPAKRSGTYRYAPNLAFVNLLKTPSIAGGRRALIDSIKQGSTVQWFGNLYYRSPATDPAYILRIAEQYLIRAEARAHLGDLEGALEDLNVIRTRAGLDPSAAATQEDILLAIENERRFEFALEPHRWFDLARTRRAKAVLEALDPTRHIEDYQLLFPIPATEVQLDPLLQQNPGYN